MGWPPAEADPPPSTHEMQHESNPQSGSEINPDITVCAEEISSATYESQHGQEVPQESHHPDLPTYIPGNSPHPSGQPHHSPINHQQHFHPHPHPHQRASPSPSTPASYPPRDAPAQPQSPHARPANYPSQGQTTPPPESYPPQASPVNYPPQSQTTPPPESYPPQTQTTPPPESYPSQTSPVNYPPQSETTPPPESYPPKAPPVNFPPESHNPQVASFPPKAPPASFPPQHSPPVASFPPKAPPVSFPPQSNPQLHPHHQEPVQFPPRQPMDATVYPHETYPQPFPPQDRPGAQVTTADGIPVPQPVVVPGPYPPNVGTQPWSTGLFDCMDEPENALMTFCFPCITFGQIAEIIDSGHTSCGTSGILYGAVAFLIGFPCLLSCTYRTKLRSKYDLVESPAPDWLIHLLFECCALSQEYRELRRRGLDPTLGWVGNLHKQQQQISMVPPPNQTMMG